MSKLFDLIVARADAAEAALKAAEALMGERPDDDAEAVATLNLVHEEWGLAFEDVVQSQPEGMAQLTEKARLIAFLVLVVHGPGPNQQVADMLRLDGLVICAVDDLAADIRRLAGTV